MKHITLLLIVAFTLYGCAASPSKSPSELQREGKAQVVGVTVNFLEDTFVPLGTKTNLHFKVVDGKNMHSMMTGSPDLLELDEGQHTIDLLCHGTFDSNLYYSHVIKDYVIEVKAGHIYQFEAQGYTNSCDVKYSDVTNQTQQSN